MQAESSTSGVQIESSQMICDNIFYGKCRCCLALGKHQYNFGKAELEMLMENLNLFLMADPRLPHLLCADCLTSLNEARNFRQKVMATETELRQAITEEVKSENFGQTSQNDPLEIRDVKSESEYELSPGNSASDHIPGTITYCNNTVKIEFEPCRESLRDCKNRTEVKTEKEASLLNKSVEKETESAKRKSRVPGTKGLRTVPQGTKGLRMVTQTSKGLRLVPINSEGLHMVPQSSKGLRLIPVSSKDLRLVVNSKLRTPQNKLRLVPISTKGLHMPQSSKSLHLPQSSKSSHMPQSSKSSHMPQSSKSSHMPKSKGVRVVPISGKGLRVVQSTKGLQVVPKSNKSRVQSKELCEELEDATNAKSKNNGTTFSKDNRKRRLKDDATQSTSKKKRDSESDDSEEAKEELEEENEKIDLKAAMLANLETTRHLLLKDNNKVRSNIILLLKNSTVLPFRNNFKSTFKCFYCDKLYIPFKELKEHIETEHSDVSETAIGKIVRSMQNLIVTADISCIKCRLCDQQCDSIEKLIEHFCKVHEKVYHETDRKPSHGILGVDLSTDTLKCHICNLEHTFFKNLLVHMNEHYGVFVCYVCGKKFLSERRYKSHVASTHENNEIKCKECSKIFKTEPAMKYHVKRVHLKTRVKCLYCPETFTAGNYVKRLNHMAEVHGITKPIFKCDICSKELANSASLAHHKMYTHKRTNINTCDLCGYMTCSNTTMKNHMIMHSGEKNFECEFCKKAFGKLGTLKLHLKIHFNDKRFVCFLCDAAFIQKNSLKNHMHSKHPESGVDVNSF